MRHHRWIAASALAFACADVASPEAERPAWKTGVEPVVAKCLPCHAAGATAPDLSSFRGAADCRSDGTSWVDRLVPALARPDHATILSAEERELLERWVAGGMTYASDLAHPPGWGGPVNSPSFHGTVLRAGSYKLLVDKTAEGACASCHLESKDREKGSAIACGSCHGEGLAERRCGTCHGSGDDPMPRARACGAPDRKDAVGAHAAHLSRTGTVAFPVIECSVCHAVPQGIGTEDHVNGMTTGRAEVRFSARASDRATYDPATRTCSGVVCHAGKTVSWTAPIEGGTCGRCHGNPPESHKIDRCTLCHGEALDENGKPKVETHLDGTVQVGSECNSCHGEAPAPTMGPDGDAGAHAAHLLDGEMSVKAECADCHLVPEAVNATGHIDSALPVEVRLSGRRSRADGRIEPTFDPMTRTCRVGCHGAHLDGSSPTPAWATGTSSSAVECGSCHGLPPLMIRGGTAMHLPSGPGFCGGCHRTSAGLPMTEDLSSLTEAGRLEHVNGCVNLWRGCEE